MRTFTKLFFILSACFTTAAAQAQYCMLPGRTTYSELQPGIVNFKLKTIDRTSGNVERPMNEPSLVVTGDSVILERGKTYTVTIAHTRDSVFFPDARNNIRVWIDYNKNFSWEDADETVISANLQTYGIFTGTFTVPSTASIGATRLRATAKMSADAGHTIPTPCDDPADPLDYHGEMEDYKVIIATPNGIEDVADQASFNIYPNPSNGTVNIAFSETSREPLKIELFDITGKNLGIILEAKDRSQTLHTFDVSNKTAAGGIYFIKASSGSYSSYQKLVRAN